MRAGSAAFGFVHSIAHRGELIVAVVAVFFGVVGGAATAQTAGGEMAPFRAFSWVPDGVDEAPRVTPFVGVNIWNPTASYPAWGANANPATAAAALASRPAGQRVMFVYGANLFDDAGHTDMFTQTADNILDAQGNASVRGIWADAGTARARAVYDDYFSRLKTHLDEEKLPTPGVNGLVLDVETNWSNWSLDSSRLDAIEADPRYATLRNQLAARHPDFASPSLSLAEVIDFLRIGGTNPGEPYLYWNSVMQGRINDALNTAIYEPFQAGFGGVSASNYQSSWISYPDAAAPPPQGTPLIPEPNGHYAFFDPADGPLFGNTGAPSLYGWVTPHMPDIHPGVDWLDPFTQVLVSANQVRAHVESAISRGQSPHVTPWVAPKSWTGESGLVVPWAGTAYYDEMVRQAIVGSGRTNVLYWNSARQRGDDQALSAILSDVAATFGEELPLTTITSGQLGYSDPFAVGAVRFADGRIVGRVTFRDTTQIATFQLDGRTVTVAADGQVGQWFSLTPVPEPSGIVLTGLGAGCLTVQALRRGGGGRTRVVGGPERG